jgi:hypothetical protein
MKRSSYIYFALLAFAIASCVDDYEDSNPPLRLDAPYAYVASSKAPGPDGIPLIGGEEVNFEVNIVDAPGVLSTINFIFSKGGEVVSHTFDQIAGQTSGTFDVLVRAPYDLNGSTTFTIEITDAQADAKVLTISRVLDVSYLHEGPDFTVEIEDPDSLAFEGDVINVTVTVNDVPSGAIGNIAVAGSAGAVTFDQAELDALIGQSSGTITGTLEIGPVVNTGGYDVTVAITDQLQNRQVIESDGIVLVCPAAVDISGTYQAIANGETGGANGGPYFNLESTITFTKVNDGQYEVDDMTFGVYPLIYEDNMPGGILNVCGFAINGIEENVDQYDDPFTITGTIIEATPEAITLEWSNTFGDSGTVTLVKQ